MSVPVLRAAGRIVVWLFDGSRWMSLRTRKLAVFGIVVSSDAEESRILVRTGKRKAITNLLCKDRLWQGFYALEGLT